MKGRRLLLLAALMAGGAVADVPVLSARPSRSSVPTRWTMTWAETCSKPRIDHFSGGAI
jgi:hypothetical protein